MRVKRYVVDSMPDALQQIRTDLGKDAVILNTKEIRSGGFLGLFSKKKIEVIAATDTASSTANSGRPRQTAAAVKPSALAQSDMSHMQGGVAVMEQRMTASEAFHTAAAVESSAAFAEQLVAARQADQLTPGKPVVSMQHGAAVYGASAAGSGNKQSASGSQETKTVVPNDTNYAASFGTKPSAADESVLAELRAMKQMMQKLSAGSLIMEEPNPVLEMMENRLLEQEIRPELVRELLTGLEEAAQDSGEEINPEFAKQIMKDKLRIILGANTHKSLEPDTRIAHFVGPTGVGKTTTIAKLAAEQVLKYRRKVGFITSDTYRIAAVDQLKTYATILGVPLEVVFSPMDLKKAFEALQDRDIIFMDTAGRNFRNEMYVSELNALLHAGGKSETYLVLSLTTKYKDMRAIAENFSKFKLDKVLFTKRDETDTFGPVINLLHEFPLQLSYITTGQNVPDDFAVANENEIIDLILEEQSDE
jgi:flagellar biosynthesis protein FlhF